MDAPSHQNNPQRKKGKGEGRSKIKLEKIENATNLQVTFSKRRAGLFKKASELDTLCGCNSFVIAFSPSQKAFSYGNPDVETVANMFLNSQQIEGYNEDPMMSQLSQEITEIESQVEFEKGEMEEIRKMRRENQGKNGGVPNLDELDYQQLDMLKKSVLNFKQSIDAKVQNHIDQPLVEEGVVFPLDHYGSNYSHVPFPDNYSAGPFFSEMTAADTGYVNPFAPPMNDNMGLRFQNPHVAGGSNPVDVQGNTDTGYGEPFVPPMNDDMGLPFQNPHVAGGSNPDDMQGNTDAGAEDPFFPWGYADNNNQGFPSNYGGADNNNQGFHGNYGGADNNNQGFHGNYGGADNSNQGFPSNYGRADNNNQGFPSNYGGDGFN